MVLSLLACSLLFALVAMGVGWPLVARAALTPDDKVVAAATWSLVAVFLVGWIIYVAALPLAAFWLLPLLAAAGLGSRWREFHATMAVSEVRQLLGSQGLVTAAAVTWLATVASYSGGGWAADWYEHWERAQFFLQHGALDTKFLGQYSLTARPPLANVITGAFLSLTRMDFPHYQLISTLTATLVFLPAALLARRWGPPRSVPILAVLLMVNPMFMQNATFAWTKLPAAFFVLTALYFFLRSDDAEPPASAPALIAVCLGAGLLAHFSAGPYAILLVVLWFWAGSTQWRAAAWWRRTVAMAALGTALLATWFGWAVTAFGSAQTFLANSSITSADARQGNQLVKIALNLFDTIVPHFLRPFDRSLIAQTSPWGAWRDWFFQNYQVNLLFVCGSLAWLVIMRELVRSRAEADRRSRRKWMLFIAGAILLGVAVHGQRDHWGLAHICLQPLVLVGLAFLAARWSTLGRGWQIVLVTGAIVDFAFGIALHFGVQSFALEHWLEPARGLNETFATLSTPAQMNLLAKVEHRLVFIADAVRLPPLAALGLITIVLAIAKRATSRPSAPLTNNAG